MCRRLVDGVPRLGDRRRCPRRAAGVAAMVGTEARPGETLPAVVLDVSGNGRGLAFLCRRRFEPGTAVRILTARSTEEDAGPASMLRVVVVHACIQWPNDAWHHGAVEDGEWDTTVPAWEEIGA